MSLYPQGFGMVTMAGTWEDCVVRYRIYRPELFTVRASVFAGSTQYAPCCPTVLTERVFVVCVLDLLTDTSPMTSRAQSMVRGVWRAEMRHVSQHNPRPRVEEHSNIVR